MTVGRGSATTQAGRLEDGEPSDHAGLQHEPDRPHRRGGAGADGHVDDATGGPEQVGRHHRPRRSGGHGRPGADEPDDPGEDEQEPADSPQQAGREAEQVVEQRSGQQVGRPVRAGDDGVEPEGGAEQDVGSGGAAVAVVEVVMAPTVAARRRPVDYLRGKRRTPRAWLASRA